MKKMVIVLSMLLWMHSTYSAYMTQLPFKRNDIDRAYRFTNSLSKHLHSKTNNPLCYSSATILISQLLACIMCKLHKKNDPRIDIILALEMLSPLISTFLMISGEENCNLELYPTNKPNLEILSCMAASACISFVILSKLLYERYCKKIALAHAKIPPSITSKIDLNNNDLINKSCLICYSSLQNPITICDKSEHLYCADCFAKWLTLKEHDNLQCIICFKEIPFENDKVVVYKPQYYLTKEDAKKFFLSSNGFLLLLFACHVLYILSIALT